MEKRNKVISKHLQKRLNELVRNKQYDEAAKLLEPMPGKEMLIHNIRWGNCYIIE